MPEGQVRIELGQTIPVLGFWHPPPPNLTIQYMKIPIRTLEPQFPAVAQAGNRGLVDGFGVKG